jgi:ceramide glucosyltransferase
MTISPLPRPRAPGANGKVGSDRDDALAEHDVLVLSDSDMVVEPDYLSRINNALDQPGVGRFPASMSGAAMRDCGAGSARR